MAGIVFHPNRIRKLQKFTDFRRDLNVSETEALGLLGSFWGGVMELNDAGDLTGWSPVYLASTVIGTSHNPERLWKALVDRRWIDVREDGKTLVHDWLDVAAPYLRSKYGRRKKKKLMEIWAFHGRVYGEDDDESDDPKVSVDSQPTANRQSVDIRSNLISSKQEVSNTGGGVGEPSERRSSVWYNAHPDLVRMRKEGQCARLEWVSDNGGRPAPIEQIAPVFDDFQGLAREYGDLFWPGVVAYCKAQKPPSVKKMLTDLPKELAKEKKARAEKEVRTVPRNVVSDDWGD